MGGKGGWGRGGIGKVSVPANRKVWNKMNDQHTTVLVSGYWSSDSDVMMAVPACAADVIVHGVTALEDLDRSIYKYISLY